MDNLKDTILKFLRLDGLINALTGYLEARVELIKVEIREEVAAILSKGLMAMIVALVAFLFLLFFCVGLAQYLNMVLESPFAGYAIVAGFFGLVLLIFIVFRKGIFNALDKQFLKMMRKKDE